MTSMARAFKLSQNLFLAKNWTIFQKNNWNVEFTSLANKVEIPSPPKKPLSSYMIFCKENRKTLLKENPSLKSPEVIKKLAEKWNNLSTDLKEKYEISARKCTLIYGEEHKKFYENLSEEQRNELARLKSQKRESRRLMKLKRALKDSGLPKRGNSAYTLFIQSESKHKSDSMQPTLFIKEAAEKWKNLPEDAKKVFEMQAQTEKENFINEMKTWRERLHEEGKMDLLKEYDDLKVKGKSAVLEDFSQSLLKETSSAKKGKSKAENVAKN